ncbi:MAG: nuclear transport factor 2 family protein [Spirosomaceae bacterium]|jgi:ketosteroid isomerase-like protein|nr:nuclear transport factor 2 family protein [Spirosomataceae bacterium]
MKKLQKFILLFGIACTWVLRSYLIHGQNTASFSTLSKAEQAVAQVEKQRFEAQVNQDFEALDKLIGEDLVYCHSSGLIDTKNSFLQSMRDGKLRYVQLNIEEIKVRMYGKTAIITGICGAKILSNGQELNTRFKYTDVYVKRKGQWQLVTWQSLRAAN